MLFVYPVEMVDDEWKPPLGLENLTKSNQHVVAIARTAPGGEDHAMYVKKITKSFTQWNFHCVNSWGQHKAEPVLNAVTQVHQVHYISVISAQLPVDEQAARDRRIRGERMNAAPSPTPPAASDHPVYEKDHSAKNMQREGDSKMSPITITICDEELSDSPARTPSPVPSENLNLNTDQQKVSYHYWLCYCTDQDVGCKNLVFQICCKT